MEEQTINSLVAMGFMVLMVWGLYRAFNQDDNHKPY